MGQSNDAVFRKLGEQLAEMFDELKLNPMREEQRRLAALVHQLEHELRITAQARRQVTINGPSPVWCESVIGRLRALEGTGNGTASPAHVNVVQLRDKIEDLGNRLSVFESEAARLNEIDTRVDVIGAKLANLEAFTNGVAQADKQGDEALWTRCDNIERDIARLNAAGPTPGWCENVIATQDALAKRVEKIDRDWRQAVHNWNGITDSVERKVDEVAKQTLETLQAQGALIARSTEVAVARRGPPPGVPMIVLARCAPHGKSDCPECGAYAVVDPTAQAYERIARSMTEERGKRMAAEASCTEHRGRVLELENQLKAKDRLFESVSRSASEVPTLRAELLQAKAQIDRMQPLVLLAQKWAALWEANKHRMAFRVRDSEEIAMDGNLATACEEYERECTRAADPDPDKDDCQVGTCDCPVVGHAIVHKSEACTCGRETDAPHDPGCALAPF